jgi:hypothetical protein
MVIVMKIFRLTSLLLQKAMLYSSHDSALLSCRVVGPQHRLEDTNERLLALRRARRRSEGQKTTKLSYKQMADSFLAY